MPTQKTEIGVKFHFTRPKDERANTAVFRELVKFNTKMDGYINGTGVRCFELITRHAMVAELMVRIALDSPEINYIFVRRINEEAEAEDR